MWRFAISSCVALLLFEAEAQPWQNVDKKLGKFIVKLKPGKNAEDFVRNYAGLDETQVSSTYHTNDGDIIVASAPTAQTPEQAASVIASSPDVALAEVAISFTVSPSSETGVPPVTDSWASTLQSMGIAVNSTEQWHLDRIDQPGRLLNGWYNVTQCGQGVNIFVVDTGVNYNNPEFGGRAFDFYPAGDSMDLHGHGTFVAALAASNTYGVAKCANIYSVRVLDADGGGDQASVGSGLAAVLSRRDRSRPSIVSMSLSGDGRSQLIDWYVARRIKFQSGTLFLTMAVFVAGTSRRCSRTTSLSSRPPVTVATTRASTRPARLRRR
jgi:subtilisin family serine protease